MTLLDRVRRGAWTAAAVGVASAVLLACAGGTESVEAAPQASTLATPEGPALVLLLAVDQLRADRLDPRQPGGLGRLAREGRVFADAALEHARTETCPGHATMLTGRHPAGAGIPGNTRVDRERMVAEYCVADPAPAGRVLGGSDDPADGRSPAALAATTLGDWLREARPEARVYSVSAKDRSAIALGGRRPNAAFWLDRKRSGAITTSRHYLSRLPTWVKRWSAEGLLEPVPDHWVHPSGNPPNGARPDVYPGEGPRWSITSPHPVKPDGDTRSSLDAFVTSPYLDRRTLDFARELIVEEQLGERGGTDLLAIGLSGTDYIGHSYGPWSQESRDALIRLDGDIGAFFGFLDARYGPGRVVVVLTADHGVLPLPEWLAEQGGGCPADGGRVSPSNLDAGLVAHLDDSFGPGAEEVDDGERPKWMLRNGYEIYFRPERVAKSGVALARVVEVADAWIEQQPGVARAWRGADIDAGRGPRPMLDLYRNSRIPGIGADLVIEPAYGCLFTPWPAGTSHGSPHDYDRDVPLVFMGPNIDPGVVRGRAAPIDIAPTLAAELGLETPHGLDGQVLMLRTVSVADGAGGALPSR